MKYNQEPDYTKVVLSGTEGTRHFDTALEQANCHHMLVSFLYAGNKGHQWFDSRIKRLGPDGSYMLDSGAHTFRMEEGYCPKFPDLAWFEDYVDRYATFIRTNKDHLDLVVNLDIDVVVGMDKVEQWDREIFRALELDGIAVCYVWHIEYGFEYWVDMCRKHRNVGLPGSLDEPEYRRHLKVAIDNGCRVHGFAATKSFILGRIPFASCDSITWKSGEMYGQTFVWENNRLRVLDKNQKSERAKYKIKWIAAGIDWARLENDEASEITKACALAWGEYIAFVEQQSRKLAYWVKPKRLIQKRFTDIDKATVEDIETFYEDRDFPWEVKGVDAARIDLKEILAFIDRDTSVVFALSKEDLDRWLVGLSITPENTSRVEIESAIRQELYRYFYDIAAEKVLPRTEDKHIHPLYELIKRQQELEDAPDMEAELPDVVEATSEGILFDSKSRNKQDEPALLNRIEHESKDDVHSNSDPISSLQDSIDTELSRSVSDRMLRVKALLLVELLYEQIKLKAQAEELRERKKQVRKQRSLRSQAAGFAIKITDAAEDIPEDLHNRCIEMADDLLAAWKEVGKLAESLPPAQTKRGSNLTPEKASAIGKLGGAPQGNQNARKHGLSSKKMPTLACDHCPHIQVCPQFKAGHICAFSQEFIAPIVLDPNDTPQKAAVKMILEKQIERARRACLFETFEGGIANKQVDKILDSIVKAAAMLDRFDNPLVPGYPMIPVRTPDGDKVPEGGVLKALFSDLKDGTVKDAEIVREDNE